MELFEAGLLNLPDLKYYGICHEITSPKWF